MTKQKVVVYLRTSTKDQDPENQKNDCIRFCKNQLGIEKPEVIKEKETAWNRSRKRPKLEVLIERAKREAREEKNEGWFLMFFLGVDREKNELRIRFKSDDYFWFYKRVYGK